MPGGTAEAQDFAIDEANGRLYVLFSRAKAAAVSDSIVQVFNSATGAFLGELDLSQAESTLTNIPERSTAIAVDNSGGATNGRVYVSTCERVKEFPNPGSIRCQEGAHSVVEVFDSTGAYVGQIDGSQTPSGPYPTDGEARAPLPTLDRLVVDGAGNLYIVRPDGSSIDKFSPSGEFLTEISKPQIHSPNDLAFDSAGGFYVANSNCQGIVKFNSAGVFQGELDAPGGSSIAVDTSSGDLYRAELGLFLSQSDSTGALLGNFGLSRVERLFELGKQLWAGNCAGGISNLEVDSSSGRIYASDKDSGIAAFGPGALATTPDVTVEPATDVGYYTATLRGTIDPNGKPTSYRFQYGSFFTAAQSAGSGTEPVEVSAQITTATPLSHDTEYPTRLIATNTDEDVTEVTERLPFKTLAVPPPTINPVTGVTSDSAHVSGTVNPQGLPTKWRFSLSGGKNVGGDAGAAAEDTAVEADFAGLEPNTTYQLTLSATNEGGQASSEVVEFTTDPEPPVVSPIAAGCLRPTSACIGVAIDPRKSPTTYYFEFGADTAYGTIIPATKDADAGSALGDSVFTAEPSSLEPETTYHFRIVAENQAGKATSPDSTFVTPATDLSDPNWPERGLELVTPPDKGNQPAEKASLGGGFSLKTTVSPDADRVLWTSSAGSPQSTIGDGPFFVSNRGSGAWQTHTPVPSATKLIGEGIFKLAPLHIAPDLRSFVVRPTNSVFSGGTAPQILLRLDDEDGSQVRLGGESDTLADASQLLGTADSRHVVTTLEEADGLVARLAHYHEGARDAVDLPACGATYPTVSIGRGARWLAQDRPVAFLYSAGEGSCKAARGIYRIDVESNERQLISGPQTSPAHFVRANGDGSAAVYSKGGEIFRWEEEEGSSCLTCATGGTDAVAGLMLASPTLEQVYFISPRRLVPDRGLPNLPCNAAKFACNLYTVDEDEVDFVAVVGLAGYSNVLPLVETDGEASLSAVVSRDGRTLVFVSADERTSADAIGGVSQLYRYDSTGGQVTCVSCGSTSAPLDGGIDIFSNGPVEPALFAVSEDGKTIGFTTRGGVVVEDVNGTRDVYEWHEGRARLLTDGLTEVADVTAGVPELWGLSRDGRNLIFRSNGYLVGNERETQGNLYNARIGGGETVEETPAPCVEDSCQGPLQTPPTTALPGSAAFSGPGNESSPRKVKKRKKARQRAREKRKQGREARRGNRNRKGKS